MTNDLVVVVAFGLACAVLLIFIVWSIATGDERNSRLFEALAKIEGRK